MKEDWQKREKHHEDTKSLDGLVIDKNGFVCKYEGQKVQRALQEKGHSSLSYETCTCKEQ